MYHLLHMMAFMLLVALGWRAIVRYFAFWAEFWLNYRGGGPKGPHPLPANDSHILNRRRAA